MKRILLFCLAIMLTQMTYAQRNCGSMEHLEDQIQNDPSILNKMQDIEDFTNHFIKSNPSTERAVTTIPVVFHVVYYRRNTVENISEAQLLSQLDVLNEDFRRTNSDANNTWSQAADSEVEFCLATVAPDGTATNGITRTSSRKRSQGTSDGVKSTSSGGKDAWPASDYLNIWVCNIGGSILGYAQFPGGNAATDGVVLDYRYTGTTGVATAPFDLGRTGTHEVGHWLNLRHIWGDGGCSVDDFVSDTPVSDGPNYSCSSQIVSCGTVDMVENYMDYTDDVCMNLFTQGQKSRMQAALAGPRASLANSNGCGTPNGGGATCTDGIMNGSETGVDCGGPDCAPCNTGGSCDAPSGLGVNSFKRKNTSVSWSSVSGATSYTVEYRVSGSSSWTSKNTTATSLNIKSDQGTNYEWRVTANCSSGSSAPSTTCTFTGNTSGSDSCGGARITNISDAVTIFPNPANETINIDISNLEGDNIKFKIYNAAGQVMKSFTLGEYNVNKVNIAGFQNGLYLLNAQTDNGSLISKRFIVSKF